MSFAVTRNFTIHSESNTYWLTPCQKAIFLYKMWSKNPFSYINTYIHKAFFFFLRSSVWKDGIWQEKSLQTRRTASERLWWKLGLIWSSSKCFNITHWACSVHTVPFWSHFRSPTKQGLLHSTCLSCAVNTHLSPQEQYWRQKTFPWVHAANCAAENFMLPEKEEVLACVCPRIQGAQLKREEKGSKMRETLKDACWLFFKFARRLRCAFVWKFLLLRA